MSDAFPSPNYTQVPNIIADELMAKMSLAQFKCIHLIIRETMGYHRREAHISINHFIEKTGLSKQGIVNAQRELEEDGLIKITRFNDKNTPSKFKINIKKTHKKNDDNPGEGSQLSVPRDVNSVDQGSQLSVPRSVEPKQSLKERERKNNVETMPSLAGKDYKDKLNKKQRSLHDEIVDYKPKHGKAPQSKDICAWMLALKKGVDEVRQSFDVFKQDEALKRIRNMGGYMRKALNEERCLQNQDFNGNRSLAMVLEKQVPEVSVRKKYVNIMHKDEIVESLEFNLPRLTFIDALITLVERFADVSGIKKCFQSMENEAITTI